MFSLRRRGETEALGIHVSRSAVTFARVVRQPDTVEVLELFSEALPREAAKWPVPLAARKLRLARRAVNLGAEEAAITVAGDLAPSHFFSMGILPDDQLGDAVKLQIENKWGSSPPQFSFQYVVLDQRGDRCRVLGVSIPIQTLKMILASFRDVNCKVDSMEIESISMANLLVYCRVARSAPVAVLNIGPFSSEVHIISRKKLALSREITLPERAGDGASVFTEDADGEPRLDPACVQAIVREANKTLDYFEIEMLSPPVQRLVLVGKGARDAGLTEALGRELGLKAGPLDTGEYVSDATRRFDPTLHGLAVATALGTGGDHED